MAYDRAEVSTTALAAILKRDHAEEYERILVDALLEALNYSSATLKSNSLATVKTNLDTLLGR